MPELRLNPATGEWVIIAPERRRPQELPLTRRRRRRPPVRDASCPFCPGNEHLTPPPVLELPGTAGGWQVRVFPNKYPVLVPEPASTAASQGPLFTAASGRGEHEVLVETPLHNRLPADRDEDEMAVMMRAYQQRYRALQGRESTRYVLIFKNQGAQAGTSTVHPHSQIIAAPLVPEREQRRYELARGHHDRTGRCLYCDMVAEEERTGARLVHSDGRLVVFHPFAAAYPAETWIVPLEHRPSLGELGEPELRALGSVLGRTLRQLRDAFADPDFNYAIHTAPKDDAHRPYYHWQLQIIPRMTVAAGLELGSGMYVNTSAPEDTAAAMRRAAD